MNTQEYLLICLMEECAEVQHAASKALRFGLLDKGEHYAHNNQVNLHSELTQLFALVVRLQVMGAIPPFVASSIDAKHVRLAKYMALSREKGILVE